MRCASPDGHPELSAEQRRRLLALVRQELRDGYLAALEAGADPAELAEELDRRRRALAEETAAADADSVPPGPDDAGPATGGGPRSDAAPSGSAGQGRLRAADDLQDRPDDPIAL